MTERQQLPRRYRRDAHSETVPSAVVPAPSTSPEDLTLLGFPAELVAGSISDGPEVASRAETSPVALRRPDASAGSLMLIGGTAGLMSLFLPWQEHGEMLGLSLATAATDIAAAEPTELVRSGLLLPLAVAVGGSVLFVLGLLAFRPARTHRATGVTALFVALAVAAGIVVRAADAGSTAVLTDPGILCGTVVAAFGLLGALKAMLTVPEIGTEA